MNDDDLLKRLRILEGDEPKELLRRWGLLDDDEQAAESMMQLASTLAALYKGLSNEGVPDPLAFELVLDWNWAMLCRSLGDIPRRSE